VRRTLALQLYSQGHVLLTRGELEQAQTAAAEGLELGRAQGDEVGAILCLEVLSAVACRQGNAAGGRRQAEEALELSQRVEFFSGLAVSLLLLAGVAALGGRFACAGRLLGFAESMVGHSETFSGSVRQALKDVLAPARAALGEGAWAAALASGQALSLEAAIAEALGEASRDA
jgi:hypothetical protein